MNDKDGENMAFTFMIVMNDAVCSIQGKKTHWMLPSATKTTCFGFYCSIFTPAQSEFTPTLSQAEECFVKFLPAKSF